MKQIKIASVFVFAAFFSITAAAQGNERDHIRRGNKLYNDSLFVKAEVEYRKALDANPGSTEAMYNLGNALLMQQKAQDAMKQYEAASRIEKNKAKLAKIYHNAGGSNIPNVLKLTNSHYAIIQMMMKLGIILHLPKKC